MAQVPDFNTTLNDLDAGILTAKLSKVLGDVALGVIEHNKAGKVTLTLDMKRIAESAQVNIHHKIAYLKPTRRGKATEEDITETPMHVNKNGHLSIAPDSQFDLFKTIQPENAE